MNNRTALKAVGKWIVVESAKSVVYTAGSMVLAVGMLAVAGKAYEIKQKHKK